MDYEYRTKLGANIRTCRKNQGLSQDKLGLMIGISCGKSYLSRIELGKCGISIDVLYRIAEALGVKASDLLDFED